MFKKGDVINAIPPKEYGEWSCLMFTEDAKPVHGNPLKYMGKARPVCQAYQDEPELGRNLFCHSCRHCYSMLFCNSYIKKSFWKFFLELSKSCSIFH